MRFLAANQKVGATIYGQDYRLRPICRRGADFRDILVTDNGSAAELLSRHGGIVSEVTFDRDKVPGFPLPWSKQREIPKDSSILVLRTGGIGDHIMLLQALAKWWQERLYDRGINLWLAVQRTMFPVFEGNTFVSRCLALPVTMDQLLEADYYVDFTELSGGDGFSTRHPADCYLEGLGVKNNRSLKEPPLISQSRLQSSVGADVVRRVRKSENGRPVILLQWKASVHMRTLPPEKLACLTRRFPEFKYVIAHAKDDSENVEAAIKEQNLNAVNISSMMDGLQDFLGAVSMVDAVVSTDSCGYHVAAALRKPALAVFGSIGSALRTCYYPDVISVDAEYSGETCKTPCGRHRGACPEAKLHKTRYSPCLLSIPDDAIAEGFRQMVDRCVV